MTILDIIVLIAMVGSIIGIITILRTASRPPIKTHPRKSAVKKTQRTPLFVDGIYRPQHRK